MHCNGDSDGDDKSFVQYFYTRLHNLHINSENLKDFLPED